MKYILLLPLIILFFISCNKDKVEISRQVKSFSSSSFIKCDSGLSVQDFFLTEDEALVIVGNGRESNSPKVTPFIMQLDLQKEISWLNFIDLDQLSIDRKVAVSPTLDDNYVILSYSDPENNFRIQCRRNKNVTRRQRNMEEYNQ